MRWRHDDGSNARDEFCIQNSFGNMLYKNLPPDLATAVEFSVADRNTVMLLPLA